MDQRVKNYYLLCTARNGSGRAHFLSQEQIAKMFTPKEQSAYFVEGRAVDQVIGGRDLPQKASWDSWPVQIMDLDDF